MGKEDEATIRGFSWFAIIFIILFSGFVCVLCFINATNYGTVLDNDDANLPDSRGKITFYLWLNIVIGFFGLYIAILFIYKLLVGNSNPYKDFFGRLVEKAVSIKNFDQAKSYKLCDNVKFSPEQCTTFNDIPFENDKVEYYLENARFISNVVNDKTDILENIYGNVCSLKDSAVDCINSKLEKNTTKNLYKTGGVRSDDDLTEAKKLSKNLIVENIKEIKDDNKEIVELETELGITSVEIENKTIKQVEKDTGKRFTDAVENAETAKSIAKILLDRNSETASGQAMSFDVGGKNIEGVSREGIPGYYTQKDTELKEAKEKKNKFDKYIQKQTIKNKKVNEKLKWGKE